MDSSANSDGLKPEREPQGQPGPVMAEMDKQLASDYVRWLILLTAICGIATVIILGVAYWLFPEGMHL